MNGRHDGLANEDEHERGADGKNKTKGIQDPAAIPLGSTIRTGTGHTLHVQMSGLPAGDRVALTSNTTGGQAAPTQLGAVDASGKFTADRGVLPPLTGEQWYFAVVCPAETGLTCGTDQQYSAATAPIWLAR